MGTSSLITPHVNIFFRPGETYQETLSINGKTVSGIPDVRFIAHHDLKVVAVTEVSWIEKPSILKKTINKSMSFFSYDFWKFCYEKLLFMIGHQIFIF